MSSGLNRIEAVLPVENATPEKARWRGVTWTNRVAQAIGGGALILMMGVTVTDVVLRNLFSIVVPGGLEINGLLMILVALSTLGVVELARGHIKVDMLLQLMPEHARLPTVAGGLLLTLGTIAITASEILKEASLLMEDSVVTGVLKVPEWPFALIAAIFMLLFAVALLINLGATLKSVIALRSPRAMAICLAWLLAAAAIFCLVLFPQTLPFEMTRASRGIVSIALCFVLIFLGVHVAAAMALTALIGISLLIGTKASLTSIGTTALDVVGDQTWSVIPLFTWMGLLVVASGFAEDLYRAAYRWIGHLPGGLASASTVSCAGLSSIVGDTLSGVYAMGSIALPQMKSYGYDMKLATASIACAATIGVMIPPSLAFIVYGMITEVSIGKLFMAGVLPGILFAVILVLLITVRTLINPSLAPRGETSTWRERLQASSGVWPVLVLMLLVLGGIYTGIVTPNEAGGIGVAGALLISVVTRRLTWRAFLQSIEQTLRLTAGIILIFLFATAFSRFIAISGLTQQIATLVADLKLGPYELIGAILAFYVVIGMFMNALPALVLTVPLFYPLAMNAGFDPVWFGVLVVIMVELGVVTPPIGVNVFAIASMTTDVSMYQIFRGVFPFWVAYFALVLLIIIFPQIALVLPSLM
ncbi:MAG: TRAP transporter large permease subunit [Ferrovibrio sp.]